MGFQKVIAIGSVGQLTISEVAGVATVKIGISDQAGGGSIAGAIKGQVSAEIDLSAIELIDAGMALIESKFPAAAPIVASVKAIIDAEAANL